MVQTCWKKVLISLLIAVPPAAAGGPSWAVYTGEEKFIFYVGIYKPIIWSFMDSDGKDDASTPWDESDYKFDLEEVVEESGYPTGVSASVNLFGIVESRISYEWFSFKYNDNSLALNGSPVERRDYVLDLMVGFDINRINHMRIMGLMFQLYPYVYGGLGYTDYHEKISFQGRTLKGNIVLADARHIDMGVGVRFGLAKLVNVGAELGLKERDFKTENPPQPTGTAAEGFLRISVAVAYGR